MPRPMRSVTPSPPITSARAPNSTWSGKRWGMTALDDQHVAGLVMALEQSIVMGIALAWLFARMLTESEEEELRRERYADESRAPSST